MSTVTRAKDLFTPSSKEFRELKKAVLKGTDAEFDAAVKKYGTELRCAVGCTVLHSAVCGASFSRVRKLGLGDGYRIVVYDGDGLISAARVWWMFHLFGHDDVAILDGGLPKWRAEGRPTENTLPILKERHLTAKRNAALVRDLEQMRANLDSAREQVLDARSAARFRGEEPEPREGLRGGHIPGSLNLPYAELLDPETKCMRPAEELRQAFVAAGVDLSRPVITTCGSGVSAAVLFLGLHLLGHHRLAVYDGSWTEWGGRDDTPIEA